MLDTHIHAEKVPKGSQDRPLEDVVIFKSGEVSLIVCCIGDQGLIPTFQVEVETVTDGDGKQVPLHAEL